MTVTSEKYVLALDTQLAANDALGKFHNYSLTGAERLDVIGARFKEMGVGRLHMTYTDSAHTMLPEDLAHGKADFIEAFLNGNTTRMFMIEGDEKYHEWLTVLEAAYNRAEKAGFPEDAKKIEAMIEYFMEKDND